MRESNFSFPIQNRASLCVTSALYDRRALDCTSPLPLTNSLMHLANLIATSERVRDILIADGGLERLVQLFRTAQSEVVHNATIHSLSFQCLYNLVANGSERIRTRVVESRFVRELAQVLETYLKRIDAIHARRRATKASTAEASAQIAEEEETVPSLMRPRRPPESAPRPSRSEEISGSLQGVERSPNVPTMIVGEGTIPAPSERRTMTPHATAVATSAALRASQIVLREDMLLSLQVLAYLSCHASLREILRFSVTGGGVLHLVEKLTHRGISPDIQQLAGMIMRSACRKDERTGLRPCAHLFCHRRERFPREFAKCQRCGKARYCSKHCQRRAWSDGHRWWCLPRERSVEEHQDRRLSSQTGFAMAG
ncbi:uncharacterized protein VTP21DRAFT_5462 [Calcarisporiella thermophila]|uniref:uncharacterized protein n=1 Tax=Calcarisporiella thermophila TaxID=911321 RepID=UPI003744515C